MTDLMEASMSLRPGDEYAHDMHHLRIRYPDLIQRHTSEEAKIIRKRLIRILGKDEACKIMEENL